MAYTYIHTYIHTETDTNTNTYGSDLRIKRYWDALQGKKNKQRGVSRASYLVCMYVCIFGMYVCILGMYVYVLTSKEGLVVLALWCMQTQTDIHTDISHVPPPALMAHT